MNSKAISNTWFGKHLTLVQSIVCISLMLLVCVMSFLSLFTVEVNMTDETKDKVEEVLGQVSGLTGAELDFVIPDTIDVSLPFLVTTVTNSVDDLSALIKGYQKVSEDLDEIEESKTSLEQTAEEMEGVTDAEEAQRAADAAREEAEALEGTVNQTKEDVTEMTEAISQDLVNLVAFGMAIVSGFQSSAVLGICYLFLLSMLLLFPMTAIISTLVALIAFLCRLKNPEKSFHTVARSFAGVVGLFPMLLLVMMLVPEVQFTAWVYVMMSLCGLGLARGFVASRLKFYERAELKYLNVLQIVSAASVGAFVLFSVTMAKSGVVFGILDGLGSYVKNAIGMVLAKNGQVDLVPMLLVLLFVVALMLAFGFLTKLICRLVCMSKRKSDSYIVSASINVLLIVIPLLLPIMGLDLGLSVGGWVLFIFSCVGILSMLAAEIVMLALRKTLFANVKKARLKEIVTGSYTYVETTEEPAEEVPAEEDPVEEVQAEEVPTEEIPVEEVSVQEASTEEITVENKVE